MAKTILIIVGVISSLAGLYALLNPFPATLAATLIAGWTFLFFGVFQIVAVFSATSWSGRIWAILIGVLGIIVGIEILANPLQSVITLTFAVAVLFIATGISKVILGFGLPSTEYRWPIVISGVVSLLLGVMIMRHFPNTAAVTLGILLGVELISNGITSLAIAFSGAADADGKRA